MSELNSELTQTGNIFTSQITNDQGLFEINNIELTSSFVEFTASGFYFNEVSGQISSAPITLTSLADLTNKSSINVNVLTHLEKKRVETLMKEGKTFGEAKDQAKREVLSIFSFVLESNADFEDYDISKNNEEGEILLAISIILQGNRSVGQLTEILSRIQNDFSDNGVLDDKNILNSLISSTLNLDLKKTRENIEKRFIELNFNSTIPNFEERIIQFLSTQDYQINLIIEGKGTVEEKVVSTPNGRSYPFQTIVELTPVPEEGWVFDGWGGDLNGKEFTKIVKVDRDINVIVKFRQPVFRLGENGVTCICENVRAGEKGVINGVEFEVVDNSLLRQRIEEGVDLSKLCTSMVTDMESLFLQLVTFNQSIGNWDVSNVTNMKWIFSQTSFNQSIENWDVSNVINMVGMFAHSPFNQPLGIWNVSSVTDMSYMFIDSPFNQPIGNWDVGNVTDMSWMFSESNFNQPIGNWDVRNVENMYMMFRESPFNRPIGDWNVSNVTDMGFMFFKTPFNQQLENWDVSSVRNLKGMFNVSQFNQPIGNWDVRKVNDMTGLFFTTPFNQNISSWCVTNILSEPDKFSTNSPLSPEYKPKWGTCPD
ncbi:BspA family leucine-rich repeat surface protein [Algoriphagus faecimaris]|nr:BspA family leucine-rich repeat surface protein [Algoriphagus faecimaris]